MAHIVAYRYGFIVALACVACGSCLHLYKEKRKEKYTSYEKKHDYQREREI